MDRMRVPLVQERWHRRAKEHTITGCPYLSHSVGAIKATSPTIQGILVFYDTMTGSTGAQAYFYWIAEWLANVLLVVIFLVIRSDIKIK